MARKRKEDGGAAIDKTPLLVEARAELERAYSLSRDRRVNQSLERVRDLLDSILPTSQE